MPFRPAPWILLLLISGNGWSSQWTGPNNEGLDAPADCGLSAPVFMSASRFDLYHLDIDRDGDVDTVQADYTQSNPVVQVFKRNSRSSYQKAFRDALDKQKGRISGVYSGMLTAGRNPELVVQLSRAPYLICYHDDQWEGFAMPPERLKGRFPLNEWAVSAARKASPLTLLRVIDWDGDGREDLLVRLRNAEQLPGGQERILSHGLYACFGGSRWAKPADRVLNLMGIRDGAELLYVNDGDGDGTLELLLLAASRIGDRIKADHLMLLRKKGGTIRLVDQWPIASTRLTLCLESDINGDAIGDLVFSDHAQQIYYRLLSRKMPGRGFSFTLETGTMPLDALPSHDGDTVLHACQSAKPDRQDFFTLSRSHNQVHLFLSGEDHVLGSRALFLPMLPTASPVAAIPYFDKAAWFGDMDGDGTQEFLIATHQPFAPDFMPPKAHKTGQDALLPLIGAILSKADGARKYAPYFRLLVYRFKNGGLSLVARLNTKLPTRLYRPERIRVDDMDQDGVRELVVEAVHCRNGRAFQALFKITGRLPLNAKMAGPDF